jgi:hypothetical protein
LCFDSAAGTLISERSGDWTEKFSKYVEFKGKQFPRLIRSSSGSKILSTIEVEELTADVPDSALFSTEGNFEIRPRCERPVASTPIRLPEPEYPANLHTRDTQLVKLIATVKETGRVDDIAIVKSQLDD